jgi:hypothetical protein
LAKLLYALSKGYRPSALCWDFRWVSISDSKPGHLWGKSLIRIWCKDADRILMSEISSHEIIDCKIFCFTKSLAASEKKCGLFWSLVIESHPVLTLFSRVIAAHFRNARFDDGFWAFPTIDSKIRPKFSDWKNFFVKSSSDIVMLSGVGVNDSSYAFRTSSCEISIFFFEFYV